MNDRFKFFRSSFYRGTSSVIIFFDYNNQATFEPFLLEAINEIYNSIGPVPIVLVGLNPTTTLHNDYIQQISEEDYIFYFEYKNKELFLKEILGFLANISVQILQESPDIIPSKIQKQIQKYIDLKNEGIENFYEILKDWGLKVVDNTVKILNKHGLFTINTVDGTVIYESLKCENCIKIEKCRKKHVIPKKALCIVAESLGWNNMYIGNDKLLILSKIFAILNEDLPDHVYKQMKIAQKCPEIVTPTQIQPIIFEEPASEEPEIYSELNILEIKNRLRFLKNLFYDGRIPHKTYFKMQNLLNRQIDEINRHNSTNNGAISILREDMLRELEVIKQISNPN